MRPDAAILVWLFLLAAVSPAAAGERLRVGIYENSPKVAVSPAGKPEGIFVDLIEAIAAKEDWEIEYVAGTWSEGLERLAAGQVDLMPDVALTAERERAFAFHREPVLSSWNQVYARAGSGIRSLPDLEGRRVAVLEGSVQQQQFEALAASFGLAPQLVPQPEFATAFRAVAEGRADAVVTNRFYGARHAPAAGLEDTAIIFAPSRLFFAAPKRADPARLAAIDRHLAEFKKDSGSVYYRSLRRWAGEELRSAVPRWLTLTTLAIAALLLASVIWAVTLRRTSARLRASEARQRQLAEELERSAAELAEAKRFLDAILDNIPNPVFWKDAELRYAGCNHCYERAFNVRRADLVGKTVLDLDYLPEADRLRYHEEQQRLLAEGSTLRREADIPFADGRVHHTLFSASGFRKEDGAPGGVVASFTDITALKETEAALAEAKRAAEAADRIKSAFLATMSHELRTPLNSIIGFTGLVLQELPGPLNEEQKKQLGMVRDSSRHLLALINDVLDISKIEAGELQVAREPFDLGASVDRVAGIVAPLAEKKGLALRIEGRDNACTLTGDARRVEQILLNLISNAIKFTEAGAVTVSVGRVADYIAREGAAPGEAVRLRVADTGMGIRPEDMAQLFLPFRQIDSAITRQHEGTGLGLAICRRLAALMGGIIEAESRFGEGSAFSVTLPLAATTEAA